MRLKTETPLGVLSANNNRSDYPSIYVHLDNRLIAVIEYNPLKNTVEIVNYAGKGDTPSNIETVEK